MSVLINILEGLFLLGCAGCVITIPLAAWKYCSVILEKNEEDTGRLGE
jgi:hypothetical protein